MIIQGALKTIFLVIIKKKKYLNVCLYEKINTNLNIRNLFFSFYTSIYVILNLHIQFMLIDMPA